MKKKVDFRKVEVILIDGEKQVLDISKHLGNTVFQKTRDLGELKIGKDIYHNGEVEIDEQQAQMLSGYVKEGFVAFVCASVCPFLENLFTNKK